MDKLILTVATTGRTTSKKDTPYVPIHPHEIADEVYKCWQAGASVAHIHIRDDEGQATTMSVDKFRETVNLIKEKNCDILINLTTSGQPGATYDERMQPMIQLKPELATFNAGSMNFANSRVFINEPQFLEELGKKMQVVNVKPEIEVFDAGMIYNSLYYLKKGILQAPPHYQLILGAPGGMAGTVENLVFLKSLLPKNATWSAFGIGKANLEVIFAAIALGATGIRVGTEDNIYYSKGVLAKSNVEFVERVKRIAHEFGKELATPTETREILGIKG